MAEWLVSSRAVVWLGTAVCSPRVFSRFGCMILQVTQPAAAHGEAETRWTTGSPAWRRSLPRQLRS